MKKLSICLGTYILVLGLVSDSSASYRLVDTIEMTCCDILNIASDGTNLLILDNGTPDKVKIVNLSGDVIGSLNTPSIFTTGITFNGSMIIFANGDNASNNFLREMDPLTGSTSSPLSSNLGFPHGLGFTGSHILVAHEATGPNGILTSVITLVDANNYNIAGTISVTIDTGVPINETPIYGIVWHNNNLFLSLQHVDRVYPDQTSYSPENIFAVETPGVEAVK